MGGHGYESLFWLCLCEVGVDVLEDVGRVQVEVAACEGVCSVFRFVAGVVERIVGVLVLARSALAIPAGSGRGQVGVVVNSHWGLWSGFHATSG